MLRNIKYVFIDNDELMAKLRQWIQTKNKI